MTERLGAHDIGAEQVIPGAGPDTLAAAASLVMTGTTETPAVSGAGEVAPTAEQGSAGEVSGSLMLYRGMSYAPGAGTVMHLTPSH